MKQFTILSTKNLNQTQLQEFENTSITLIHRDFIQTQPKLFTLNQLFSYLIFTSQNAVEGILNHQDISKIKEKSVLCVGIKTKDLLEKNGFKVLDCVRGAKALIEVIENQYKKESFTFFCGQNRLDTLPNYFNSNQMIWNTHEVYQTELTPVKIENELDGILFFSPSGVESFFLKNKINPNQVAFCIGETTAETAQKKGFQKVEIANEPSIESVIERAITYFNGEL
mgnify:FL=1